MKRKNKKYNKTLKEVAPYLTLGTELMLYILIFTLLGYWLDKKFDSLPILTLILSFFGIFIGFYKFFKTVAKLNNNKNKRT